MAQTGPTSGGSNSGRPQAGILGPDIDLPKPDEAPYSEYGRQVKAMSDKQCPLSTWIVPDENVYRPAGVRQCIPSTGYCTPPRDRSIEQYPGGKRHRDHEEPEHGSLPSACTKGRESDPRGEIENRDNLATPKTLREKQDNYMHSDADSDNLVEAKELSIVKEKLGAIVHDTPGIRTIDKKTSLDVRSGTSMTPDKIVIRVGGERFVTFATTLSKPPGTRLSMLTKSDPSYDPYSGEYFFDRNPKLFGYILDFYRTGELHFPHSLCGPLLKKEMEFWAIPEDCIAPCCWKTFTEYEEEQKMLQILESSFNGYKQHLLEYQRALRTQTGCTKLREDLWIFLEDPTSSLAARLFSHVYVFLLLASIAVVVMETHPLFRVPHPAHPVEEPEMLSRLSSFSRNSTNQKIQMYINTEPHFSLIIIDYICTFFFSLELCVRFAIWPGKLSFFSSFFNIIDLFSVSPMLANSLVTLVKPSFWVHHDLFVAYCVFSVSSVFRSVRILKVAKHNRGLQIIWLAIKSSFKEILLLILLMAIGTLVFSTMIYYVEFGESDNFVDIPIGFWWSIVTMTTVGYGDMTPRTPLGYVVGSLCAVSGMLITGLPIPVIANSFHLYYTYARIKTKLDQHRPVVLAE